MAYHDGVQMVKASEMKLGDVIKLGDWKYSYASVISDRDEFIELHRPYIHVSEDCGVDYIGSEYLSLPKSSPFEYQKVNS